MKKITLLISLVMSVSAFAGQLDIKEKIWAQQAIIATYQISNRTYIKDQRELAKYFTSLAWKKYLQGLNKIKFQQFLEKNNFQVDAVALKPVTLQTIDKGSWKASMPVLVQYKNPQYEQQQTIYVTIGFKPAAPKQGVLGYQITSFTSKILDKPCQCMVDKGKKNLSLQNQPK